MFDRLQQKWKVNGWQLTLILCTFALGGSMCGYITRLLIQPMAIENAFLYGTVYFILLTLLWPLCVLTISIPFGQFAFFRNYLRKMGARLGIGKDSSLDDKAIHIAIFASGTGTNALRIMEHFAQHPRIKVVLLVSNKAGAGALHHAANKGVSTMVIEKDRFFRGDAYLPELDSAGIDFIVLAGFLWKIPATLIQAYPRHIINIHPALLPRYGGKGMYGHHVHEAVLASGDEQSGITIHYVDEQYDHGATIFQAMCPVEKNDSTESLAQRIHALEHAHYPKVIEQVVMEALG
ncbi:MAG TPA: phosphoribosylglycinamide formyltransferase [Phnomibacter sp.]|nr:phosphoribosylglycinamide formyltransferase [Phnomibacter sp.]